ncbi:MAG: PilN domain-containing protein, partial [Candidatus Wildermuthbacteria bacterium]|nr:PilN domain-containing protein [Candidatus Wildermuthbacteria bacterium]
RLILILGITALAALLSFILILFSIKVSILTNLEVGKIYFQQKERELAVPKNKEAEENIKNSNLIFSGLSDFYQKQIGLVDVQEKISETIPEGAYLATLNFNPSSSQIFISGFSPTRENLLEFRKNLEGEKFFKEIYFPPENWVAKTEVNFNASFKIKWP